jgi:hypothetical protein
MKPYNKILVFALIISLFFYTKVIAEPIEIINPLNLTTKDQVVYFSNLYGGDSKIALQVMECESGGDHNNVGDGGRSRGIMQFQKETFTRMSKAMGLKLNYSSRYDQIKLATWALTQPEFASEWTTYKAIKNGGKYSFYSRQMKKHYTVKCSLT